MITVPSGEITRTQAIEGLRELRNKAVQFEKQKDASFVRWPDIDSLINRIAIYGFPPVAQDGHVVSVLTFTFPLQAFLNEGMTVEEIKTEMEGLRELAGGDDAPPGTKCEVEVIFPEDA